MNMLVAYDRCRRALAEANSLDEGKQVRDELEHIKLYAKQIEDKALLEEAVIAQMRTDRRMGMILAAYRADGRIAEGRRAKDEPTGRVTLKEIGIGKKLSSRMQKAAAMPDDSFKEIEDTARVKIRSGGAILVDPINAAAKEAEIAGRRAAHAARTVNGGCIADLGDMVREGRKFGSIGSEP
jgi:hypothetical protein